MAKKLHHLFLLFFFTVFSFSTHALDYATPNVSLQSPHYRDIEKLISFGLIDIYISGQKPYSRTEFARLTAEAESHLDRLKNETEKEAAENILKKLEKEFSFEMVQIGKKEGEKQFYDIRFLHRLRINSTFSNGDARQTNIDNGLGVLDAQINPILAYQEGRHFTKGLNNSFESQHFLNISPYFNIFVEPRFQTQIGIEGSADENQVYLQQGTVKGVYKNVALTAGRESLIWGQGLNANLLLSNNARGLDQIRISNESPFFLPLFLKYLGPSKFSFFYSDLGNETYFKHSYLAGFKLSFKPWSFFEFGMSNLVMSGGAGSPDGSFTDRLGNLFPFVQTFQGNQVQIDNKMGGLDFRFRVPQLRNTEFYLEAIFDDTPGSFKAFVLDDGGFIGGLYIPRLNKTGTLDFRTEIHRTGKRYYRHGQFLSGMAQNKKILGDELGPDAFAIYNYLNWDICENHLLKFAAQYEHRSNDFYIGPRAIYDTFKKTIILPKEKRIQLSSEWVYRPQNNPFTLSTKIAFERVNNFNFSSGVSRNNLLASLNLDFNFDKYFQKTSNNR